MTQQLVVVTGVRPKVYHHPDCFVLERATYTIDMLEVAVITEHPNVRCCKICDGQQEQLRCICGGVVERRAHPQERYVLSCDSCTSTFLKGKTEEASGG